MKTIKQNQKGFSHILLLLIIVATAIGGVGYTVAARSTNRDVLGAQTNQWENPSKDKLTRCAIKNVPKKPRHGYVISPTLYFYNRELTPQNPPITYTLNFYDKNGKLSDLSKGEISDLKSTKSMGSSKTKINLKYSVRYRSDAITSGAYKAVVDQKVIHFSCSAKFTLPKTPKNAKPDPAPTDSGGVQIFGDS